MNPRSLLCHWIGSPALVFAALSLWSGGDLAAYELLVSNSADRSDAVVLDASEQDGIIYIFVSPESHIARVRFYLDDPDRSGSPVQTENFAPYDFGGTERDGRARPFDTRSLSDGEHTVTAAISVSGPDPVIHATFSVANAGNLPPTASFSPNCSGLNCSFDASASHDPDGSISLYTWEFGDGGTGDGRLIDHTYDASGEYRVRLVVTDNDGATAAVAHDVIAVGGGEGCADISPLDCAQVRVRGDYPIAFDGADGGIVDKNGVGTGFTMVDPPTTSGNPSPDPDAPGHWAEKLEVDTSARVLRIETTAGIQHLDSNDLVNALGVGLNVPSATVTSRVTLVDLPAAPGRWAQAGLWFGSADNFGRGTTEDDYIKLVVGSPASGSYVVEAAYELGGLRIGSTAVALPAGIETVGLSLTVQPGSRSVQARYDPGDGEQIVRTFFDVPDEWFSFDQAGIDPNVATRSYGGIFATHRRASAAQVFTFKDFSIEEAVGGGSAELAFDRWQIPVPRPTALAWGPDERLYVSEWFGTIHAFRLDTETRTVIDEQVITAIRDSNGGANRLTLGLTVDPASTAGDVVLWVAHSDGSVNNGVVNSGVISRLSGPGFATVENRITGLPRAIANHAINEIHFGPDGRLYIAAGGNTGAGAANNAPTEFRDRPEQPLSAAILAADVNAPGFSGACATPIGAFGIPASCDVVVYASGLRNSYDFTWHSNGVMYATDNGLGVTGTYPPVPSPPCTALADPALHNPGSQPDTLVRAQPGKYYGHPNPYRNECVFKDGSIQGVAPLPNYESPLFILGPNLSANGIIEYLGDRFFSKVLGELFIANFSVGDNLSRTRLNDSGTAVVEHGILTTGFNDPLALAQDNEGHIYVAEFNANQVAVLDAQPLLPEPVGGWTSRAPVPEAILDAGGIGAGGKLYMVGGKTGASHVSSLYIYDPAADNWMSGPDLPGVAVENPAVTTLGGQVYVFGGSTQPFSGAVSSSARLDPAGPSWTGLEPMNVARGGATAQALEGKIYVIGGMSAAGASLNSVEVYDPVADVWSAGTPMQTRRDNPGSAVLNGKLHVFGGRTRNADGGTLDGTLSTMEIYDPVTGEWTFGASMAAGRRAMAVGNISGRALVIGGESPVVPENEEYDPVSDTWRLLTPMVTPRHGAAAATIRGAVYVVGGGPVAGSSFTDVNEVFRY